MTTNQWQPLSAREAGLVAEHTTYDTAAPHLSGPLRDWIEREASEEFARRVLLKLRIPAGPDPREQLARETPTERLLDVIDCMLHLDITGARYQEAAITGHELTGDPAARLYEILADSGSAYTIAEGPDGRARLERVVDATATDAAETASQSAKDAGRPDAARHLADAWAKAYGLHPDPSGAYTDAIRAVEDVANPLFLPAGATPTLGKVLRRLRDHTHEYELVILGKDATPAGIEPVIAMGALLWEGHRDRHPGGQTSAPVTEEAAQAAVHLAATLVQWLSTGAVRRKS